MIARLLAAAAIAGLALPAAAATKSWQVADFQRVRIEGPYAVRVQGGAPTAVRASGPQRAIDTLAIEQHGDTLVVRQVRTAGWTNWSWGKGEQPLTVDVSTRQVSAATVAGSGTVTIAATRGDALDLTFSGSGDLSVSGIDVARFRLASSGSGSVTAAGRAGQADVTLVGSGDIRAAGLAVDAAVAKLVGSGNLAIGARRSADVTLSGAGDVAITGPAACTVHRSGSGDVRCQGGASGAAD